MEFEKIEYKRGTVLKCTGRIDSASAPDFEKALMELVTNRKSIILDLEKVNFISSSGWSAFIRVENELKKTCQKNLIIVSLSENLRDSMDLIGILPYFSLFDNLLDAVASL